MASTACYLERSTQPPGATVSASFDWTPGKLTLTVVATWDDDSVPTPPEYVGLKDCLICVDRRLVYRNRGGDQLEGLWRPATTAKVGNTRTFTVETRTDYFGWRPGYHLVTFSFLHDDDHVMYETSFGMTLPESPPPPQTPSPALVPGKILRNYFLLVPLRNPMTEPGMTVQSLRDAGINCLTVGGFAWPGTSTYAQWRASWDALVLADVDWCETHGFSCILNMDGLYRSAVERQWWDTCSWRDDALRHVRDQLASRRPTAAAISGLDEIAWGAGQAPVDTRALHALWRENPGAPPWAWPAYSPQGYETTDQADYAIRYIVQSSVDTTPSLSESGRGLSLPQRARLHEIMGERTTSLPSGWPLGCQVGACLTYQKMVDGAHCCPYPSPSARDILLTEGLLPEHAMAAVWLPLALVRPIPTLLLTYFYDWLGAKQKRAAAVKQPIGMLQQGVVFGSELWRAMGRAFKSVEKREALLTSRTPLPPSYLDNWATGGVEGLEIAINCAPHARTWKGSSVPAGGVWFSDGEVL